MAKFDVELDYKGIKAVTSVETRVSVKTATLFKSHPASHVKPKLILNRYYHSKEMFQDASRCIFDNYKAKLMYIIYNPTPNQFSFGRLHYAAQPLPISLAQDKGMLGFDVAI